MAMEFEQQPRESDKAFAAFNLYLSMGPERSTAAVGKQLGKSAGLIERWCTKYAWPARVTAYAAHLALVERQASEAGLRVQAAVAVKRRSEHLEEEWAVRGELLAAGREALRRWWANANRCGSLGDIAKVLDLASRLGRLSSGMPTDHTEVSGEVALTLDVEWEVAIKKVYGRAAPVVDAEVLAGPEPSPGVRPPSPASAGEGRGQGQRLLTSSATVDKGGEQ